VSLSDEERTHWSEVRATREEVLKRDRAIASSLESMSVTLERPTKGGKLFGAVPTAEIIAAIQVQLDAASSTTHLASAGAVAEVATAIRAPGTYAVDVHVGDASATVRLVIQGVEKEKEKKGKKGKGEAAKK
jgi:ribosomal protein L9